MANGDEEDDFYSAAAWADFVEPSVCDDTSVKGSDSVQNPSPTDNTSRPPSSDNRSHDFSERHERLRSRSRSGSPRHSKRSRWAESVKEQDQNQSNFRSKSSNVLNSQHYSSSDRFQEDRRNSRDVVLPRHEQDRPLEVFGVYHGVVVRVEPYGAFIKLEGVRRCRDGLAHVSQFGESGPPQPGERVWVKVLSLTEEERPSDGRLQQKISLSISLVDQQSGRDLDQTNDQARAACSGGRGGGNGQTLSEELPELYSIHHGTVAKASTTLYGFNDVLQC
jgi:ATP-dependent RNA helicase DHX8/PRP22